MSWRDSARAAMARIANEERRLQEGKIQAEDDKRFYLASSIFLEYAKSQLNNPEVRRETAGVVGQARFRIWAKVSVECADALLESLSSKSNEE